MSDLTFEWNSRKASENKRKHGVSFEEAKSAFFDENARVISDPEHSDDESRFILLGLSTSCVYLSWSIAIEKQTKSFESSQRGRRIRPNADSTRTFYHEEDIRFCTLHEESLREAAKKATDDSSRRGHY